MIGVATGADARPGEAGVSARIAVTEPQGERLFERRAAIGGEGAEVVVPGSPAGALLWIERGETAWTAQALDGGKMPRGSGSKHKFSIHSLGPEFTDARRRT